MSVIDAENAALSASSIATELPEEEKTVGRSESTTNDTDEPAEGDPSAEKLSDTKNSEMNESGSETSASFDLSSLAEIVNVSKIEADGSGSRILLEDESIEDHSTDEQEENQQLDEKASEDSQALPEDYFETQYTALKSREESRKDTISASIDLGVTSKTDDTYTDDNQQKDTVSFKFPASFTSLSETTKVASSITLNEEPEIDRNMYYELHNLYTNKLDEVKRKNRHFQKRMTAFYTKRKMYHYLHTEPKYEVEEQKKYEKILGALDELNDNSTREIQNLKQEIEHLKNNLHHQKEEVTTLYEKLLTQEAEVIKMISVAADEKEKATAAKFVERLIKRQKQSIHFIEKIRLAYLKSRNKYNEMKEKLDTINHIGSHLYLADYEELKDDNRILADRLEEKEMALNVTRKQCQHVVQLLAHNREKLANVILDLECFSENLEIVTTEYMDMREQLGVLKLDRDELRAEIRKLGGEIRLLGNTRLLKDMEKTKRELEKGKHQLEQYKAHFKHVSEKIKMLRRPRNSREELTEYIEKCKSNIIRQESVKTTKPLATKKKHYEMFTG